MKKTIMDEVNELEKLVKELQYKLQQDEADKKTLENFYDFYQRGEIDKETYQEAEKVYRKVFFDRWF